MINTFKVILDKPITVVVASYGGGGTTLLLKEIAKFGTTNDPLDNDGYKHFPIPPISFSKTVKYIYIYGDPVLATVSLFKRKFQVHQAVKLNRFNLFRRKIDPNLDISAYASAGRDSLRFSEHFLEWRRWTQGKQILFLKYEEIFNNLEVIRDFLDLPKEFVEQFPAKRPRASSSMSVDHITQENLRTMYFDFSTQIEILPSVEIIGSGTNRSELRQLFSQKFFVAVLLSIKNSRIFSITRKSHS